MTNEEADIEALRSAQPSWKRDGLGIRGPQSGSGEPKSEPLQKFGDMNSTRATRQIIPSG